MARIAREYDDPDMEELAQQTRFARRQTNYCRCGPMPGTCPGWSNCPMNDEEETHDCELA